MMYQVLFWLTFLTSLGARAWTATLPGTRDLHRPPTRLFATDNDEEQARVLLERAQKAREEAESMERDLVSSKLTALEGLLERQSKLSTADVQDIQDRIDQLKNYNNKNATAAPQVPAVAEEDANEEAKPHEAIQKFLEEEEEPREIIQELTPEGRKTLEQVQGIVFDLKDFINATLVEAEVDIKEDFDLDMDELNEIQGDLDATLAGNITQDELDALTDLVGFVKGVADTFGIKGSEWEDLKKDFQQQFVNSSKEYQTELLELEKDPLYFDRITEFSTFIPPQILDATERLNETDMEEEFVPRVMLPIDNDFSLTSIHPKKIAGAYLLQGTCKLKNGDQVVERIDRQLVETGLQDKYQVYYIRDIGGIIELSETQFIDEMQSGMDEENLVETVANLAKPGLLVTSSKVDLSPLTEPSARAPWSILAVLSTAAFAVECYNQDFGLVEQFAVGLTSPIFLGLLGIQLVHELGHFAAASLNKIEIAYPITLIPSPSTGLLHSNTQIKSSPKNNNALFDFAIMGPILGLAASWSALLLGLQLTAAVKADQIPSLPHLPLDFFQLSTLTSSTIETFLGTDVLLSLDPVSDTVAVHPLVIAGHVGILLNALNLLPSRKTTDGGRMLTAVNGRTGPLAEFLPPLFGLFLFVQGFRGWETCNILILYSLITSISQHQVEVPCRNDVDPAGGLRLPAFIATTALAIIALSPAF